MSASIFWAKDILSRSSKDDLQIIWAASNSSAIEFDISFSALNYNFVSFYRTKFTFCLTKKFEIFTVFNFQIENFPMKS